MMIFVRPVIVWSFAISAGSSGRQARIRGLILVFSIRLLSIHKAATHDPLILPAALAAPASQHSLKEEPSSKAEIKPAAK